MTNSGTKLGVVEFENVSLAIEQGHQLFSGVSFSLGAGSLNFVTGRSGSGKSALLQLMAGACQSWGGRIKIFQEELRQGDKEQLRKLQSRVGVVFQNHRLVGHLSPRGNLSLPLLIDGVHGDDLDKPISELLAWLGPEIADADAVSALSSGQKRLLAIARSLVRSPHLVVADEPTSSLDRGQKFLMLRFLEDLCGLGTTVVIATTDDELMSQNPYSSRLCIEGGSIYHAQDAELSAASIGIEPSYP